MLTHHFSLDESKQLSNEYVEVSWPVSKWHIVQRLGVKNGSFVWI